MNHPEQFPPTKFLLKTVMKTPERFMMLMVGLMIASIWGPLWFPLQTAVICFWGLGILLPTILILYIWNIIWDRQHPALPSEKDIDE